MQSTVLKNCYPAPKHSGQGLCGSWSPSRKCGDQGLSWVTRGGGQLTRCLSCHCRITSKITGKRVMGPAQVSASRSTPFPPRPPFLIEASPFRVPLYIMIMTTLNSKKTGITVSRHNAMLPPVCAFCCALSHHPETR